jgi:hypothetical protein
MKLQVVARFSATSDLTTTGRADQAFAVSQNEKVAEK